MEIGNGTTAVMDAAALRGRPTPAVWAEYKRACSAALRNELLVRNLPLARYQAERIAKRLPDEVQLDDLLSAGIFGLLDAIDAF
ncbi:MAG TPA: hypothetical protein VK324_07970, partial [Tepidisphaeraceae bacterium]|nr:hypothetical protein [Tepidisphaeraceae bacterium]